MVKINDTVLKKVHGFLLKLVENGINVESAFLFGSCAKSCETEWSDIDVAVISPDFSDDRFEEGVRLSKIAQSIDARIEPVSFSPETFVEDDPLVWEIKKEGFRLDWVATPNRLFTSKLSQ